MNEYRWSKRTLGVGLILVCLALAAIMWTKKREASSTTTENAAVSVQVATVGLQTILETVSAVGILTANADVMVSAETAGRTVAAPMQVGERVAKGALLAQVDDELLIIALDQAQAQLLMAETNLDKSKRDLQRVEKLQLADGASTSDLEGARLAVRAAEAQYKAAHVAFKYSQRQLNDSKIRAPISGVIAAKYLEVGEMAGPGRQIANIVDLDKMKIKLDIAENDIVKMNKGQTCQVTLDACPGRVFPGKVWSVGAKSENPTGHIYPVEVMMDNPPQSGIRAGMFGRVTIQVGALPDAIVINQDAIVTSDDGRQQVYVIENQHAKRRDIKTGVSHAPFVHVREGLRVGETLVIFGQTTLRDGEAVRIVEKR